MTLRTPPRPIQYWGVNEVRMCLHAHSKYASVGQYEHSVYGVCARARSVINIGSDRGGYKSGNERAHARINIT